MERAGSLSGGASLENGGPAQCHAQAGYHSHPERRREGCGLEAAGGPISTVDYAVERSALHQIGIADLGGNVDAQRSLSKGAVSSATTAYEDVSARNERSDTSRPFWQPRALNLDLGDCRIEIAKVFCGKLTRGKGQ